jgi:hypothetical protein
MKVQAAAKTFSRLCEIFSAIQQENLHRRRSFEPATISGYIFWGNMSLVFLAGSFTAKTSVKAIEEQYKVKSRDRYTDYPFCR